MISADEALAVAEAYVKSYSTDRLSAADIVALFQAPSLASGEAKVRLARALRRGTQHRAALYPPTLLPRVLATIDQPVYKVSEEWGHSWRSWREIVLRQRGRDGGCWNRERNLMEGSRNHHFIRRREAPAFPFSFSRCFPSKQPVRFAVALSFSLLLACLCWTSPSFFL